MMQDLQTLLYDIFLPFHYIPIIYLFTAHKIYISKQEKQIVS